MLLFFSVSVINSISLFICEQQVRSIQRDPIYNYKHFNYDSEQLEMDYLKIYFILYSFSLVGLASSFFFLVTT